MASTCGRFDFSTHMKDHVKLCTYTYPHRVFERRRHSTAVVWLIISWNTVLVAWLLSSPVANYIAWPLPAWCISLLLDLAPHFPSTQGPPPADATPFSIVHLFKKFPANQARCSTFSCTPYHSCPWNMEACKKELAKFKNLLNPPPLQFIKKPCMASIFTTCVTATLTVSIYKPNYEHMMKSSEVAE